MGAHISVLHILLFSVKNNHPNLVFWITHASFFEGCLTPARWTKLKYELPKSLKGPWRFIPANFKKITCALFSFLRALHERMFFLRFARFKGGWMCPKIPCALTWFLGAISASKFFDTLRPIYYMVLWLKTDLLWGLPNTLKIIKTEILAHKKLKGFLKNNICEFQEYSTILSSPKIPCALFRYLHALCMCKIFDALRSI